MDYRTSTVGGISCIKAVAKAVGARISTGKMDVVAVVELTNDSYTHSEYGKTFVPTMAIESWLEIDGPDAAVSPEPEAIAEDTQEDPPEPTTPRSRGRARAAALIDEGEAEVPAEEEKPVRRRRARSA